eukprot:782033_1
MPSWRREVRTMHWRLIKHWCVFRTSYVNTLYKNMEWILNKPSLVILILATPHVLYQLCVYNRTFGKQHTMKTFTEQSIEYDNKEFKEITKDFNQRNDESFRSQMDTMYMHKTGSLEYALVSFHRGLKQQLIDPQKYKLYEGQCAALNHIVDAYRNNQPLPTDKKTALLKQKRYQTILKVMREHNAIVKGEELNREQEVEILNDITNSTNNHNNTNNKQLSGNKRKPNPSKDPLAHKKRKQNKLRVLD